MRTCADEVTAVARAIAEQLEHDYDRLPFVSVAYQYDQRTLRRLARAAIAAMRKT